MSNFTVSLFLKAFDQSSGVINKVGKQLSGLNIDQIRQSQKLNLQRRADLRGQMLDIAALGLAFSAPIRSAIKFESAMADVKKVVDFDSPDGFIKMEQTIKEMARVIPISQVGLAAIVESGGQLGVASEDLDDFALSAAKMATAFDMMPDAAGDATAKLSNIFQIPINEIDSLGDAINHLSNNSAAKAGQMIEATLRVGGTGSQFGLLPQQIAALSGAFIALGKRPETAATGINAMLMKMQTATTQGKKFSQALKFMGLDAKQLEKDIGEDAQGALLSFLETVEGVEKKDKAKVLGALFGNEFADDIASLVGGLDGYREQVDLIADSSKYAGSMTAEFQSRSKTTANTLILLKNVTGELSINFGAALLPAINDIANALIPMTVGLAEITQAFPTVTTYVMGTIGALIGLKIATVAGAYAFTFLKGAALSSALALVKVGTVMRAVGLLMYSNPITAIVGGIALAATAIYNNWGGIADFFKGIFKSITDMMPDWVQNLLSGDGNATIIGKEIKSVQYGEALPSALDSGQGNNQVGGELTLKFENAPSGLNVSDAKTVNPNFGINVNDGMMMVGG